MRNIMLLTILFYGPVPTASATLLYGRKIIKRTDFSLYQPRLYQPLLIMVIVVPQMNCLFCLFSWWLHLHLRVQPMPHPSVLSTLHTHSACWRKAVWVGLVSVRQWPWPIFGCSGYASLLDLSIQRQFGTILPNSSLSFRHAPNKRKLTKNNSIST